MAKSRQRSLSISEPNVKLEEEIEAVRRRPVKGLIYLGHLNTKNIFPKDPNIDNSSDSQDSRTDSARPMKPRLLPSERRARQMRRANSNNNLNKNGNTRTRGSDTNTRRNSANKQKLDKICREFKEFRVDSDDNSRASSSSSRSTKNSLMICYFCHKKIENREELSSLDGIMCHIECSRCSMCKTVMDDDDYKIEDDKIVCYECMRKCFQIKCRACKNTIFDDTFQQIGPMAYHNYCYKCYICSRNMRNQDVVIVNGHIYCHRDAKR